MNPATTLSCWCRTLLASVLLSAPGSLAAQVNFYGTGDLPGGDFYSQVRDAIHTPDGILAVGTASRFSPGGGDTPVMWTPAGGLVALANPFPANTSTAFVTARVISPDGALIGGSMRDAAAGNLRTPSLWTNQGTSATRLGFLGGAGTPNVGLNGLSADGSVGYGFTRAGGVPSMSFRYTASGGMIALGFLHPGDDSSIPAAHAVSADGNVVVGNSSNSGSATGLFAYRYTYTGSGPTGGAMVALPPLPGGTSTSVFVMTPDATKTIGVADSPGFPNGQLVRWNEGGPMEALGSPNPALSFNVLGGVSADGSTITIALFDTVSGANGVTYLRNPSGWFELSSILTHAGVDLTGWSLDAVIGMSTDGTLVYGSGQHDGGTEGWVAEFPANYLRNYGDTTPPVLTLPADLVAEATGPLGAVVTFSAAAVDNIDGPVPVAYSIPPGSVFPLGTTTVGVSATDGSGNTATGSFTVTVRDTVPPVITSLATSAPSLWPPNHKMVAVTVTAGTSDAVGPVATHIVAVTSNEPDNGLGDGDTANDIVITGAMTVSLRAERSGTGNGRIYTITVEAGDAAGNTSTGTVTVTVPKNKGGR